MTMTELQVLIAHDSEEMTAEIRDALTDHIERVHAVQDGKDALSRLLREHPSVLVVDVGLPGRAPFELCDDIAQERPTEIDFLGGKVVEYGRSAGIPTPCYATLTNLVKAIETAVRFYEEPPTNGMTVTTSWCDIWRSRIPG